MACIHFQRFDENEYILNFALFCAHNEEGVLLVHTSYMRTHDRCTQRFVRTMLNDMRKGSGIQIFSFIPFPLFLFIDDVFL